MAKIRQEIAAHPEHPQRSMLDAFERHAAGKPSRAAFSLWWLGDGRWRYNRTPIEDSGTPGGAYVDFGNDGGRAWVLNPDSATIVTASAPPSPQYDYSSVSGEITRTLGVLLYGAANQLAVLNPSVHSVQALPGEMWRAEITADAERRMVMTGTWIAAEGRGQFDRTEIYGPPDTQHPVVVYEFSGWRHDEASGRELPSRIDQIEGGRLSKRWIIPAWGTTTDGEQDLLLAPPKQGKNDPARGVLRLGQLSDDDNGEQRVYEDPASGNASAVTQLDGGRTRILRWTGWILAGLIVVALGALQVRRAVSTRQSRRA